MSDSCFSKGHAIHEIGHSIGLWHEHSRPDRDEFIEVLFEHIKKAKQDNFGKLTQEKFELVPDVGYDIESIMHFGPYAFSKDDNDPDKKTIQLKDSAPLDYKHCTNLLRMGQRDELSYLDKLRVNKLYSCNGKSICTCTTSHLYNVEQPAIWLQLSKVYPSLFDKLAFIYS